MTRLGAEQAPGERVVAGSWSQGARQNGHTCVAFPVAPCLPRGARAHAAVHSSVLGALPSTPPSWGREQPLQSGSRARAVPGRDEAPTQGPCRLPAPPAPEQRGLALAMPPEASAGLQGQGSRALPWLLPPQCWAPRSGPTQPTALHCPRLFVQLRQPTREEEQPQGVRRWCLAPSLRPGAHLYAEGIRRNLPWPRPGELLAPRNSLRRRPSAVGKIRTGPSAATHALVTLQAAATEIIFIYNLFDHPVSKRSCLV